MLTLNHHQQFLYREVSILAWGASVQRAKLYRSGLSFQDRAADGFREKVLDFVESALLSSYIASCSEEKHIANIQALVAFGSSAGANLLGPDGYKFGVAQKLLNLLLKYLWCLGHIPEPPHCPVDRLILAKTALRGKVNWTDIKTEDEYKKAIEAIRVVAALAKLSLAQWELQFYGRR